MSAAEHRHPCPQGGGTASMVWTSQGRAASWSRSQGGSFTLSLGTTVLQHFHFSP